MVVGVQRGGAADKAGIAAGDFIVKLGEHAIETPDDLASAIIELEPGTRVPVEIVRDGKRQTLDVELGRRPPLRRPVAEGG